MTLDKFTQHCANPYYEEKNGELIIAGRTVSSIASDAGGTPLYVYDSRVMTQKVDELRALLPAAVELHYAVKANPMPDVVNHFARIVDGLDVASEREMMVAIASGMDPLEISFAGPGKRPQELEAAVNAGIVLNAESALEVQRLAEISNRTGRRPKVAIRVNPDFELKTSGMKMAGGPKQFGIDAEVVPDLLGQMNSMSLDFWGFHIFSGSQNLRAQSLIEAQSKTMELAIKLSKYAPAPVRLLNLGGGFGIPYFPGESQLDVAPVARHLHELVPTIQSALPEAHIVLELGRYLVGESGVYVCRVIDKKISRGQVFLITDGGLHHHLAASGNFGQVLRKNYPVTIANRIGSPRSETASVVGPLCTPLDLLCDRMPLPEAQVGDLVAVFQSGAYGLTASPLGFLSHPEPVEIFY